MLFVWPPSLPQTVQKGYTESIGFNILRTPMDSGPAKMRFRGKKPDTLKVSFIMTDAQVSTLNSFIEETIRGVSRFEFPHPRLGTKEVRMVPSQEGNMYSLEYLEQGFYKVSIDLEIVL
jgi:hypothetical protein